MSKQNPKSAERRSFLNLFHAGAAAIAALAAGRVAKGQEKPAAARAPFQPARHAQDDWMDEIPGKHRMVIDTTTADGMRDGLLYANNYLTASRNDYGLQNSDMAIIVIARHVSAGHGFNNDMWAKYGAAMTVQPGPAPADGAAKEPPKANPSATGLASLAGMGVQFAICGLSTRRIASTIARTSGVTVDEVLAELKANLVKNARIVPAGIIAVNRAQERGYTLTKA